MTPHIKPPIASVITDEQVAACNRQLMAQEGAKYAVAMAVSVTRFREVSVKPTAMRSDKSDPDVSSREPIGTCLATCPGL